LLPPRRVGPELDSRRPEHGETDGSARDQVTSKTRLTPNVQNSLGGTAPTCRSVRCPTARSASVERRSRPSVRYSCPILSSDTNRRLSPLLRRAQMQLRLPSVLLSIVGLLILTAPVSAGADAVAHWTSQRQARLAPVTWASFHVRLGSGRREDCIESAGAPAPVLRCDRYDKTLGQQVSVTISNGKARRLASPSDATGDPVGRRLAAAHTWWRGPFWCRATTVSLRCHDRHTGHGFVVTAHRLRLH
jgi:hypothetical protein